MLMGGEKIRLFAGEGGGIVLLHTPTPPAIVLVAEICLPLLCVKIFYSSKIILFYLPIIIYLYITLYVLLRTVNVL